MRASLVTLVFVAPISAAIACGGRLNGVRDEGGIDDAVTCPASLTNTSPCNATVSGCTGSSPVYNCDGTVGGYNACQCVGSGQDWLWSCEASSDPDCRDASACPDPSTIAPGGACSGSSAVSCSSDIPIYDCYGNVSGEALCTCSGQTWACSETEPPTCMGVGVCPAPINVQQGEACAMANQPCPGDPQQCGSEALYDAFECIGGTWQDVAVTICDVDGGPPVETGPPDTGPPDTGPPGHDE